MVQTEQFNTKRLVLEADHTGAMTPRRPNGQWALNFHIHVSYDKRRSRAVVVEYDGCFFLFFNVKFVSLG